MTIEALTNDATEPVGAITAGGREHFYSTHELTEHGEPFATQYELIVDLPPRRWVMVQRQGGLCDGGWGVEIELHTDGYAAATSDARRWAHAVLAAADFADQLEQGRADVVPSAVVAVDRLLDEALNYLCDADNLAVMTSVPHDVSDLLRHSIAEAVKRLESIDSGQLPSTSVGY